MKKLLILSVTLFLFINTYSQSYQQKLDQYLDLLTSKNKAMGVLTIAKAGQVVYSHAFGYIDSNNGQHTPLKENTKFRIGSVTKMFTAVMVLQLAEEGKLKLTDHLDKYFPQIQNADKITIAQVLAHRSGIHDITNDKVFKDERFSGATKEQNLAAIAKATPDFEPGTQYAYSNSGFYVLGCLIEKITKKSYQDALQSRVNAKIGLKDTYVAIGNTEPERNEAFSFKYVSDWERQQDTHSSFLLGSGSLVSTTADMAKFIQSLFDLKLITKESLDQMLAQKLGIETFTYNGKPAWGHTGGIDGFGAWLVYVPDDGLAVAYAANGKVYPVADIINAVFDMYWSKPFTIPAFDEMEIAPEILEKYVGTYSAPDAPVKFVVSREGGTLFVQMNTQPVIRLTATAEDRFKVESAGLSFTFNVQKKQMTLTRGGRDRVFNKEN